MPNKFNQKENNNDNSTIFTYTVNFEEENGKK